MTDSRDLLDDLQASTPEVRVGLSRAGVRGVSKAIRLRWEGAEKLIAAEIDCTVDLDSAQKGVHMSRFPELFVVEHAHLQPRFVEDSVRISLKSALERYDEALADGDFLFARQLNFETIHSHEVLAERFGLVGELRNELETGEPPVRHTELRQWLAA